MKYCEIIAENVKQAGLSFGLGVAVDSRESKRSG
jgi:hypothetical protein